MHGLVMILRLIVVRARHSIGFLALCYFLRVLLVSQLVPDQSCGLEIEDELCAVEGLEGRQAQARKGRSIGAHFCWEPAMGDDTTGAANTTSVSRAWRRLAKWLGDITHTKREANAETSRWKNRFYRHPRPNPAQTSKEQVMSF